MSALLTPGLSYRQRERLADALRRVGGLPLGSITPLYVDCDVAAARALNVRREEPANCRGVVLNIASEHKLPVDVVGFAYGIATGVRLGRTFAPEPRSRSKWISDEYKRLTEPNRRDAQRYIRRLLRIQEPPPPKAAPIADEVAAAKRWSREAGRRAWAESKGGA